MCQANRNEPAGVRPGRALVVAAAALAAWAGALALLAALAGSAVRAWTASVDPRPEDVVAAMAAAGGAAVACWLALGALLTVASAAAPASGAVGRLVGRWSAATTPALIRRVVGAGLGVAVLTAGMPGAALAGPSVAAATAPGRPDHVAELDPAWWPTTPGPVAGGSAPPAAQQAAGPARSSAPRAEGVGAAVNRPRTVTVSPGDTLWGLAARHLGVGASAARISAEWPRWYAVNRLAIGPDADLLRPGIRLLVPPPLDHTAPRTPGAPDGGRGQAERHAGATS